MSLERRLEELGGVASYRQLVSVVGRADLDKALDCGAVIRVSRGRFALPGLDSAAREAHARSAVLSHASAAWAWGWALKSVPERPHLTVPVKRKVDASADVRLYRRDLRADEVVDGRTSQELTLEQCLRTMPFSDGLAVADSALRDGFGPERLRALARGSRGPGAVALRRVAAVADGSAANPFESALRAACLGVDGLRVRPQVRIAAARVDLADEDLRIVLEADSFEWHGGRRALRRDAQRYNRLVVAGWLVLRFAWEDVMFCPEEVRAVLDNAVAAAHRRSKPS